MTLIIVLTLLTVNIANAQVFTDGDIIHLKDANGTLTDANLVEISNTSNSTTLDLLFRVTITDSMPAGTLINVVTVVPTDQTAPTPTFHYKNGKQWSALQTTTTNGIVSITYSALKNIATEQSATTVEVRVRFATVPAYRFQVQLGRDTAASNPSDSLDRVYFDCHTGAISHAVYDVTNDGSVDNADITAVSVAMQNNSLTGDVSEDGRINYVDFDLITFVVAQGVSIATTPPTNPPTNSTPVTVNTIPDQTLTFGTPVVTVDVDVSSYFSDPDGDALTYTATSSDTTKATASVSSATVTLTPVAIGTSTISVTATDPDALSATQTFTATVVQGNNAPVITVTIPDVDIGNSDTYGVYAHDHFSDPDGDALTYTASTTDSNIASVSVGGVGNSTVYIYANALGSVTITVTVTDTSSATATQTFTATVVPKGPTAVGTIPDQTVKVGAAATTVDVSSYFNEPDLQTLTYTASSLDTSITTVSVSSATVSVTGVAVGTGTVTVTATDPDALSATQSFSVTVVANLPPTPINTLGDLTLDTGGGGASIANLRQYFSDAEGDVLSFSAASSDTAVATASISSVDKNRLNVYAHAVGTATITVTATDPFGGTATQSFKITVVQLPARADVIPGLSSGELSQFSTLLTYDTVIFNELHNGSDDTNDWLELRNVSGTDLLLDDWQLTIQTGSGMAVIPFPTGTVIPTGEVLLLTNTEMATTADTPVSTAVSEAFVLPQTDFAVTLRSPTVFGDIAGNYLEDEAERPETVPALTVGIVWERVQPISFGYRTEAWMESTSADGLGTPGYHTHHVSSTDLNNDGTVNILDLVLVAGQIGQSATVNPADVNNDGVINTADLLLVAEAF